VSNSLGCKTHDARALVVAIAVLAGIVAVLVALAFAELLIPVGGRGDSMAPTMPACTAAVSSAQTGHPTRVRAPASRSG
jgi:hypothetical protein